jgi:NADH-quinone oxidoreductase subunit M
MQIPFLDSPLSLVLCLPVLTLVVLSIGGLLARGLLGLDRLPDGVWKAGGLAGFGLVLISAVALILLRFDPERLGYQLVERVDWLPALGAHYVVGVDGINLFLVLLTALLPPVILLATWNQIDRSVAHFVACSLVLETALLGVLLALNLVLFYFFWELTALTLYFLVGVWGTGSRVRSAGAFMLHSSIGSFLMLAGIVSLATLSAAQGNAVDLDVLGGSLHGGTDLLSMPIAASALGGAWYHAQPWLFATFAGALAVRVPLIPLHTWLADVLRDTPTAISALVVGSFTATGVYGFLRFVLPLFPDAATAAAPFAIGLAVLGVAYGGALALVQNEAKRLIAFVALAQLSLAMLGVFSLNVHGLTGSIIQLLALGLGLTTLVILFGALEERRSTLCLDDYGGLAKPMPVLTVLLGLTIFSGVGMPALAGFIGEWLVLLGGFESHPSAMAIACLGVILLAGSLLRVLSRVALGPVQNPENRGLIDLDWRERIACLLLIVPLIAIGVQPNYLLRRVEPAVLDLLAQIDARHAQPVSEPQATPKPTPMPNDDDTSGEAI